jgi:hypothetical protein
VAGFVAGTIRLGISLSAPAARRSKMRDLHETELTLVTGAGGTKNNNGYGNGEESGTSPGKSWGHNPQLIKYNEGPRGQR